MRILMGITLNNRLTPGYRRPMLILQQRSVEGLQVMFWLVRMFICNFRACKLMWAMYIFGDRSLEMDMRNRKRIERESVHEGEQRELETREKMYKKSNKSV